MRVWCDLESSQSASASSSTTSSWSRPDPCRRFQPLEGLGDVDYWTNREAIWASSIPASLVVLGGGAVGVELAQFFRRMGADVTLVENSGHLLARLDADAGSLLAERFAQDGIRVLVETRADSVEAAAVELASTSRRVRRSTRRDCWSQPDASRASKGSGSSRSAWRSRSAA